MAWPCNSVDPEEHYRRLERLLAELYLVLRALLAQGAPLLPPTQHQPPQPPPPQDPSGSGQRRSRGGRSRCSERPAGGSNHQNEPDDNSGGSCGGGGQQNQRKCALACRLVSCHTAQQDGHWDAIGLSLKNIADGLKSHRQSIPSSGMSLLERFFDLDPLLQCCENEKIAERNKPPILIT